MCYGIVVTETQMAVLNARYKPYFKPEMPKITSQITMIKHYFLSGFDHPRLPVVTATGIRFMEWGLIPRFETEFKHNPEINRLNVRDDSLFTKKSFQASASEGRFGILPVRGFIENEHRIKGDTNHKIPYYITDKDLDFLNIAVLYEIFKDKNTGEEKETFAIITTEATEFMAKIHNSAKRMPLIFPHSDKLINWFNPGMSLKTREKAVRYRFDNLAAHTVHKNINKPGVFKQTGDIIKPYNYSESDFVKDRINKKAAARGR